MNANQVWNAQSRSVSDGALVVKDAEFNEICVIREGSDRAYGDQNDADIRHANLLSAAPDMRDAIRFVLNDANTTLDYECRLILLAALQKASNGR